MSNIKMTDNIKLRIQNYISFKSFATVLQIENGEVNPEKCYVKIKIDLDYYINNPDYHVIDINFKEKTVNGMLNLFNAEIIQRL